ncbi:hypothetical protein C7212DRAFT_344281 [Tuber magnatum]|uniref:Uncharacterized protein n=1 Tax=Tuber magnatum TaxID=42249 RepID=A0A317SUL0_9PEZI|nr:hypothetical protein C7212DRAFT_344281 [Tuber magnatum]
MDALLTGLRDNTSRSTPPPRCNTPHRYERVIQHEEQDLVGYDTRSSAQTQKEQTPRKHSQNEKQTRRETQSKRSPHNFEYTAIIPQTAHTHTLSPTSDNSYPPGHFWQQPPIRWTPPAPFQKPISLTSQIPHPVCKNTPADRNSPDRTCAERGTGTCWLGNGTITVSASSANLDFHVPPGFIELDYWTENMTIVPYPLTAPLVHLYSDINDRWFSGVELRMIGPSNSTTAGLRGRRDWAAAGPA